MINLILEATSSLSIFEFQGCLLGTIESLDILYMKFPCTEIWECVLMRGEMNLHGFEISSWRENKFYSYGVSFRLHFKTTRYVDGHASQQTFVGLQDVLKTCLEDVLKTSWRGTKCLLGISVFNHGPPANLNQYLTNLYLINIYFTNLRRIQNVLVRTQ